MKSILEGRPSLKAEIDKIAEVAGYLWQNGWAERNGGSITVNVTAYADDEIARLPAISDVKPMTDRYKAVLNLQYATNLNKWIFDFTASLNGPCHVWDFMRNIDPAYKDGWTKPYPLLFAQVTKRFKGFDIYVGGENLTNFTQPNPIIGADKPFDMGFDASCIWGPLMGARVYAGVRMTIWKTEKI